MKYRSVSMKWAPVISIIIAATLFLINLIRAFNVSITFDESTTYREYVLAPFANIVHMVPASANNHILNSLLSKIFVLFFGPDLIVLRLGNILAFLLFLICSYLIFDKLFKNKWWVLGGFLLINLNPFLFDFWGLSRGYGLSIGFMTAGIYFLVVYVQTKKIVALAVCLLLGVLAVYSNLSVLNFFLALNILIVFWGVRELAKEFKGKRWVSMLLLALAANGLLYILIALPALSLKSHGQLYFGGTSGLIRDTFYTLLKESLFISGEGMHNVIIGLSYLLAGFIIFSGFYWLYQMKAKRDKNAGVGFLLWLLLALPLLSTVLQYLVMGNLYLIERTALFLYPLFIIQFVYLLYHQTKDYKLIATSAFSLCILVFNGNFISNLNFNHTRSWEYNKYDPVVLNRMMRHNSEGKRLKLRLFWMFMSTFEYYYATGYDKVLMPIEKRFEEPPPNSTYNYYFIHKNELSDVPVNDYSLDTTLDNGQFLLFKRNW